MMVADSPRPADSPDERGIRRLLIANRGEIACRIMRTAQARGIVCIAVYSDPDADALFVQQADLAYSLGGVTSAQTYLDVDKIVAAASATGADAVHPGYGFGSENADYARAIIEAGLTWIGPRPDSIAAMAQKVPAKRLVAAAGVPLVPGAELTAGVADDALLAAGRSVGFPLMVKASAGGGGKGMSVVSGEDELVEAVTAASRQAASAFGDATVFLERYLPAARHIEVQVFGDAHGNVVHLFERECSIQRRHQKVVEEAPAVRLADHVRSGLHSAAVAAARAIDYVGAGTVEFLVDGDEYYFLEMNTRLQVEHPVTEEITGLDLVGWQLDVAAGGRLPTPPQSPVGHAIEVRLYAEDPRHDDLPSTGVVEVFDVADPRLRVDTGFTAGSRVSPYYDPMLAKVIAAGRSRDEAAAKLLAGLSAARIHGVTTNRDMLCAILATPAFLNDITTTAFLTEHPEVRNSGPSTEIRQAHAVAAAAAVWSRHGSDVPDVAAGVAAPAWRNVARPAGVAMRLAGDDAQALTAADVQVHRRRGPNADQWGVAAAPEHLGAEAEEVLWLGITVDVSAADQVVVVRDGVRRSLTVRTVADPDDGIQVWVDDNRHHTMWLVPARFHDRELAAAAAGPSAPVPGTVTAVLVAPGDVVAAGDALVVLEAMKMEHRVVADVDGEVAEVTVKVGDSVDAHHVVVRLNSAESEQ